MGREANVSFRADITDLRKELKKIPGVTDVEAKRMVTKLTRQLKKAEKESTKAWKAARKNGPKKYGQSVAGLKGIFTAVIGGVAVQQVGRLISKFADLNDQINQTAKEAREVGESAEDYQRIVGAIDLLTRGGVKGSEVVSKLRKNLIDAADGSASMTRALDKMGLAVEDFTGLNAEDQLALMAEGLDTITVESVKSQVALTLLGRSGGKLLPAFKGGSGALKNAADEIERAGLISNEAAAEAEALADSAHLLGLAWMGVKSDLLAEVSPAIRETTDNIREMMAQARESGEIRALGAALASLADSDLLGGIEALASKTTTVVKATEGLVNVYNVLKAPVQLLPRLLYDVFDSMSEGEIRTTALAASWGALAESGSELIGKGWILDQTTSQLALDLGILDDKMGDVSWRTESLGTGLDASGSSIEAWQEKMEGMGGAVSDTNAHLSSQLEMLRMLGLAGAARPAPTEERKSRPRGPARDTGPQGEFTGIIDEAHANNLRLLEIYAAGEKGKTDLVWEGAGERFRIRDEEWDFEKEFAKWREEQIEKERAMSAAAAAEKLGYVQSYADSAMMIQRGLTDAVVRSTEEGTEARRKAEAEAFVANKIAALANVTVSTAAAVAKANEMGYPQSIAAMIAAAGVGTAQTAIVAAEMPTFHTGGEVSATLEAGEHVSSRQAVRNAGGHDALQELEKGPATGPDFVSVHVNNQTTQAMEYESLRLRSGPVWELVRTRQPSRTYLRDPYQGGA